MWQPKSMRPPEELVAEFNSGKGRLTPNEERLVDLFTYKKTGQRLSKFQEKTASRMAATEAPLEIEALAGALAEDVTIPDSSKAMQPKGKSQKITLGGPQTPPQKL